MSTADRDAENTLRIDTCHEHELLHLVVRHLDAVDPRRVSAQCS